MLASDSHRLTSGNILFNLVRFALPFLFANLLISMYGAADVLIVSYFAAPATLSATATGAQVVMTIMSLAIGLGIGGTILIGQYFGAKREKDVHEAISTEFVLFGYISVVCSALLFTLAPSIADWMRAPEDARAETINYIRICGGGIVFSFIYDVISSILRGLGDSKNPLKFVAIACVCNVLLDLLFVGYFRWGAGGAAAATIIAQGISALIAIIYLKTHKFIFDFKLKSFKFVPQKAKMILKLGVPTAIQHAIIFFSFTVMAVFVNKLGVAASAVFGIANRVNGFMFLPPLAFGSAISVMAAQNMGAGKPERAKESFYTGFLLSLIFAIPGYMILSVCPDELIRLANSDAEIIRLGSEFMRAYSPNCLLMALVMCLDGLFNGCGRTSFTMTNNIISSVVFRIPLIVIATSMTEIGCAMPWSTFVQVACSCVYLCTGRWRKQLIPQHEKSA